LICVTNVPNSSFPVGDSESRMPARWGNPLEVGGGEASVEDVALDFDLVLRPDLNLDVLDLGLWGGMPT
jgi:hypothetical protein